MINNGIKSVVQFHNVIHRFHAGRVTGTAIMELIVSQELSSVYHDPLLLVLLYLRKSYNNLDQGGLLQTI